MDTKGKRIVLNASDGITFRVQEEEKEIVIEAIPEKRASSYSHNYKNPFIPEGYVHVRGTTWDKGFVIRNTADKSEFVWIPVGYLESDGTLDGVHFNEKFGSRNFYDEDAFGFKYQDKFNKELLKSVKKYGGFYIARYHASKNKGKITFKRGRKPWGNCSSLVAEKAAAEYAKDSKDIVSILTSGACYDSMLCWIIESGDKTSYNVLYNALSWANDGWTAPTGSDKNARACNIYDIMGNVDEWTSEKSGGDKCNPYYRGRAIWSDYDEYTWTPARRIIIEEDYGEYPPFYDVSFRAVLYKK